LPINYKLVNSGHKNLNTLNSFLTNFISDNFFKEIINVCLYPSNFSASAIGEANSTTNYLLNFLIDLDKTVSSLKVNNLAQLKNMIHMSKTVLNIREFGNTIIDINNVQQHLPNLDLPQQNLLNDIKINPVVRNEEDFRVHIDRLINNIQIYYEVCSISSGIIEFDQFLEYSSSNSVSVYEAASLYKERVIRLYNDLNKLQSLNKIENEKDYFIISNKESTKELSKNLVGYISSDYSSFKTGYDIVDDNVDGVESASFYLISAPSNHGKSIWMANIAHQIITENNTDFEENDAILVITLEDDIRKLVRRLCSIFGNYKQETIKYMYLQGYQCMKANNDNNIKNRFTEIMDNVILTSLYSQTKGKVNLIVKHAPEGTFSAGDMSKFIDRIYVEHNIKVKMGIIDYLDVMIPTVGASGDTYRDQGIITHEMRSLTRNHKMPIISATQNNKQSENMQFKQTNMSIGDSYLKVRYSDFIFMCRMDNTKSIFDPAVVKCCFSQTHYNNQNQLDPAILKYKDQITENLIPFEIEITKTKEDGKGVVKYCLFCKNNLRIYDNIQQYLDDLPDMIKRSDLLLKDIEILKDMAISCVSDDYINNILEDPNLDLNDEDQYNEIINDADEYNGQVIQFPVVAINQ
jgi:hypothetical protein